MPIGPIPPGCIAISAYEEQNFTQDISRGFVCQLSAGCVDLTDVVVTECELPLLYQFFYPGTNPRTVRAELKVHITFRFTGTVDGFTFQGKGAFDSTVVFEEVFFPKWAAASERMDCGSTLVCRARYDGRDPVTGAHTFIVHVTGGLTCVGRTTFPHEHVIVRKCPTEP